MSKAQKKIDTLTREIEQKKALLSDLGQRVKEERRRNETRKKIIYGAAFLAFLETIHPDKAPHVKAKIEAMIANNKDRQFLELPPL